MSSPVIETVELLIRVRGTLTPFAVRIAFQARHKLRKTHFYECGVRYPCHTWERLDGEIDCYTDVLKEATTNGLNPELSQARYSPHIHHSDAVKASAAP